MPPPAHSSILNAHVRITQSITHRTPALSVCCRSKQFYRYPNANNAWTYRGPTCWGGPFPGHLRAQHPPPPHPASPLAVLRKWVLWTQNALQPLETEELPTIIPIEYKLGQLVRNKLVHDRLLHCRLIRPLLNKQIENSTKRSYCKSCVSKGTKTREVCF